MEIVRNMMNIPLGTYAKVFGSLAVVTLTWEHIGRKREEKLRQEKEKFLIEENLKIPPDTNTENPNPNRKSTKQIHDEVLKIVVKRPSIALTYGATQSKKFFEYCGKQFAWLSSYLTQLDLKDFGKTIYDVGKPTFDLFIASPFYFIKGYADKASSYVKKEWMIYVGSILGILMLIFGWYKLGHYCPRINFWTPIVTFIREHLPSMNFARLMNA